jgi:stage III sporulation protein AH
MNKKQAVIIMTLLALIVCAGVLATKLNSPLYVNGSSAAKATTNSFNTSVNQTTKATTDYFADTKLSRDQKDAQTLQTLKALVDDKNVSTQNRNDAAEKYTKIAMDSNYEDKIESTLKSKGFDSAVCSIEDTTARVIVKSTAALTDKQTRDIKNVVVGIAKINDVEIEIKQ